MQNPLDRGSGPQLLKMLQIWWARAGPEVNLTFGEDEFVVGDKVLLLETEEVGTWAIQNEVMSYSL